MKLDFSGISLGKSYEHIGKDHSLTVWGEYYQDIPDDLELTSFDVTELQKLNFDGAYIACYRGPQGEIVFHGSQDLIFIYYCIADGVIYFSDDYYHLVEKYDHVTWDLNAISDYFEDAWNNIAKYDRTPLKEIHKFDIWTYMMIAPAAEAYQIGCWKNIRKERAYTIHTMEAFKRDFLETLDYYLTNIHDRYHDVAVPVSGGIDANLIAARWSQLFPHDKTIFFTSKVDDVADESKIAANMQKVVTSPIKYVPIKTQEEDLLSLLRAYMDRYLPPRFINELSEQYFITNLWENGIRCMNLSGMGADADFGCFGGEYQWLMYEKLQKLHFSKARDIYEAISVSFSGGGVTSYIASFLLVPDFMQKRLPKYLGISANPISRLLSKRLCRSGNRKRSETMRKRSAMPRRMAQPA